MLGRLARYLRFVGCDTAYLRGKTDDELVEIASREDRLLLTRDRELSRRSARAFLVESPVLAEQWRAVRARWPSVPVVVTFDRCSVCNGLLARLPADAEPAPGAAGPAGPRHVRGPLFGCRECGHVYWEGSHTARIRAQIEAWEAEP